MRIHFKHECIEFYFDCRCQSYPNVPPNWELVKPPGECCYGCQLGTIIGTDMTCSYGGKEYKQDETWTDGCKFSCVCNDAINGQYQCKKLCPKWDLPDVCYWNPAPPGKCCSQPECPPPYVITGYPDN
ncbi:protein kinase C-binding protein NELL2-like [Mytilus edulis]|uniref:protein kinase C-binding protein NELL2-like n=1 Tax=Mytilus edulis TaxID=6550 RepID=UPI0039F114EB